MLAFGQDLLNEAFHHKRHAFLQADLKTRHDSAGFCADDLGLSCILLVFLGLIRIDLTVLIASNELSENSSEVC